MRSRALLAGLLAVAGLAMPVPVLALPAVTVTFTASPNPSVTTTRFKIVIKLSAAATNVMFHLEASGGFGDPDGSVCLPAPNCTITGGANTPRWSYPTASGTLTATFETQVHPGMLVRFFSDGGMSVTNPPTVKMKDPTVTTKLTRSPTGVVMPGDTLHITVKTATNAGPLSNELWVELPDGVSAPTNLPDGANYEGWHAVNRYMTADLTASYGFDVVVTAAIGTKLVFKGYFGINSWDDGTTMSFVVGVSPTPRPTATPRATPKPTPKPTPTATAVLTPEPTAAPTPTELQEPSVAPVASVDDPSSSPSAAAPSAPPATTAPEASPVATDAGSGIVVGLALALIVGVGVFLALRRQVRGRGAAP